MENWIAVDWDLRRDPRVFRLARLLDASPATAVGHLVLLWTWAARYARSGQLVGSDPVVIAAAAEWPGEPDPFARALRAAGVLTDDDELTGWKDIIGP